MRNNTALYRITRPLFLETEEEHEKVHHAFFYPDQLSVYFL